MVNDMNASDRLSGLQAALAEQGVVDVKFFFSKDGASPTKVVNDVVNVLEALMEGRTQKFAGIGDTVRAG